ncbi:MAG: cupin domain-containing protein [Marinicaulis sp.]|nr:cupin domain-containing protein [Marinicaulis sp.]NNE41274.1 cupin domain-containing protein [Marinicaulis sp.]
MLNLFLLLQVVGAQPPENPIPPSGGSIIMREDLPDPLEAGWEGEPVCEILQETEDLRALRCTFPPGVGHEKHFHGPHFGYIVEGGVMEIKDRTGKKTRTLKSGASWQSDGVKWHEVLNVGDTTSVYVIVESKGVTE